MTKDSFFRLCESCVLREDPAAGGNAVRLLRFEGDSSNITAPGQFVSIELPGKFLRRPFSVCDWDEGWFSVVAERIGDGTELLHRLAAGTELRVLTGLGTGFSVAESAKAPVLVGGGTGLSPLAGLARRLRMRGQEPAVLLGFRDEAARFGRELFEGTGSVRYAEDVFASLRETAHDTVYACGSQAMMLELLRREPGTAQVAFDVRMGCGFGACMGCAIRTRDGMKRVCKDGPVFRKEELLWES